MTTATTSHEQRQTEHERYEAYQRWEQRQLADPRFASVRMLVDDLRNHDEVLPETWERFDVEERTWAAEVLNAPHSHKDRFNFDGQDVIVKETDGAHPRITLREVYEDGLAKTQAEVEEDPGLAFQLPRDELFMNFYEEIEAMMRGETEHDTIHMISTCPRPEEVSDDPEEAAKLLAKKFYDQSRGKSFDYTARRLPNGQLELSATTLDNSNLRAHAKVLQKSGFESVSFAMVKSHEYGAYLSYDSTVDRPIESVIAARVAVYDEALERQTGRTYHNGRPKAENDIEAHKFFAEHCEEYWAGYRAYHELLARHMAGKGAHHELNSYLLRCLDRQEQVGRSVLDQEAIDRLRSQLQVGIITRDMAMSCRELLVYDHHATLSAQLKKFKETGKVDQLDFANDKGFLGAYAEAASGNGAEAAANGETFAGCETATSVSNLTTAAQTATESGVTLEQALRMQDKEARHCLEIQLLGYTIRKNVSCPFCSKQVDARDTQATIECLDTDCRIVLDKATGETWTRESLFDASSTENVVEKSSIKLHNNQEYSLGGQMYRRQMHIVVGGADLVYVDAAGQRIVGPAAEQIEAAILNQLEFESQAS